MPPLTAAQILALKQKAENPAVYKDLATPESDIGPQFNEQFWIKESLIEFAPKQWFSQLTSTINPPKHMGKKIVRYLYLPLLDDRNQNDQGLDATGATIVNGNLYGSSRDAGTIMEWQPTLTQYGGRVNRVYFTRLKIESTFEEFGFFYDYTEDSLQFDTDAELKKHNYREAIRGAIKIAEDRLQIDIISAAGTILYGGAATMRSQLTGEAGATISTVTYGTLITLSLKLDDLDCPTNYKVIKGSTYTDTATIREARLMYVGSQVIKDLLQLEDYHGKQALTEKHHYAYADGSNIAHGEYGEVAGFRVIKIGKDMVRARHAGATVVDNAGYYSSIDPVDGIEKYDVEFMLVVGHNSFETISFKNTYDAKSNKFTIFTQDPKPKIRSRNDPYGKTGFTVVTWWYGFALLRPEWIARVEVVAQK